MIGGADGCRTGWVVCRRDAKGVLDMRVVKTLAEACEGLSVLAVDMPIGFVDVPRPPRACEVEARRLLPGKTSSVFPTPCRPALACTTHAEANAASRKLGIGINQQTFHLFPKMREVDELLRSRPQLKRIVYEAHPELAFARMNGDRPVLSKKRQPEGYAERRRLLAKHGFACPVDRLSGAARDDILDAIAVCRTALLIAERKAARLGPARARDRCGLPMNIWY
ncbi:Predicted nuclease (RNAse H fold) [Rhodospirillales bacterium URHD0017]|nr:Predicted nuclease (RNAse H fold) [Rhodospirillales bacterium URHD0017]